MLISSANPGQQQALSTANTSRLSLGSIPGRSGVDPATPRHWQDSSPAELASAQQALSLRPTSAVLGQDTVSVLAISPRQRRDPSPAELAIAKQSAQDASTAAVADHLNFSASAISPRSRRDPSPAELAIAKQSSLGISSGGAAATEHTQGSGLSVKPNKDLSPPEFTVQNQKSLDNGFFGSSQFHVNSAAMSPRQRRDPSPAELGLIRQQSFASQVKISRLSTYQRACTCKPCPKQLT